MSNTERAGRLALRVQTDMDGVEWWRAYYALPDTMAGAQLLATIRLALVQDPDRKARFLQLMKECMVELVEEITGEEIVTTYLERAPEHEREKL